MELIFDKPDNLSFRTYVDIFHANSQLFHDYIFVIVRLKYCYPNLSNVQFISLCVFAKRIVGL